MESGYFELDELITRILEDIVPPRKVDAAYLFGETADNEESVLKAGVFLYRSGLAKKITLCGTPKGHGYPGVKSWIRKLVEAGVPKKAISAILPVKDFPPSTHAEAFALTRYARARDWKNVYIVAPPLHQLRAFITSVSAVFKEKSRLKLYSFPGLPQNWEEHVVHSQGIQKGTRSELLAKELEKIEKYYRKGSLVSAKEVLKYLDKRDGK